jgi:gluconokinase
MGVSGCGKSTVASGLAKQLGGRFTDGDDLHSAANIAKMAAGLPLNDDDRFPWLDRVGDTLSNGTGPQIIACSALKRIYRDRIRAAAGGPVTFVCLQGPRDLLLKRMQAREGHFMPVALLDSQLATLELPDAAENAVIVSIDQPPDEIVSDAIRALKTAAG